MKYKQVQAPSLSLSSLLFVLSPVERFVFMLPEFVQHRLNAQHEELIPQVESKLQVLLAGAVVEDGVDERHEGGLQAHVVTVLARRTVQIRHDALKKKNRSNNMI